jgi:predicted lipoprotein with Yx(FWY)xxD motif
VTKRAHLALALATVAGLAACGGSTNTSTASTPAPTATPAPVLKTTTATVGTASKTIMTDANGMTVYYYTPDKGAGKVTCTGTCLQNWPPVLLASGVTKPVGDKGVTGTLGTIASPNGGTQVTYNGWPVYTFVKDTKAGDTTGQNVGGKWFVVTPDVQPNT